MNLPFCPIWQCMTEFLELLLELAKYTKYVKHLKWLWEPIVVASDGNRSWLVWKQNCSPFFDDKP